MIVIGLLDRRFGIIRVKLAGLLGFMRHLQHPNTHSIPWSNRIPPLGLPLLPHHHSIHLHLRGHLRHSLARSDLWLDPTQLLVIEVVGHSARYHRKVAKS